jgi:hypothetical protein
MRTLGAPWAAVMWMVAVAVSVSCALSMLSDSDKRFQCGQIRCEAIELRRSEYYDPLSGVNDTIFCNFRNKPILWCFYYNGGHRLPLGNSLA